MLISLPLDDAGVDTDQAPVRLLAGLGRTARRQPADARQEAAIGILGIDPRFDGMAIEAHIGLRERQRLAGSDADHQLDEIEPGDAFGYRMLDLQTGVHLEEVE